jgi:hypothetical protein
MKNEGVARTRSVSAARLLIAVRVAPRFSR